MAHPPVDPLSVARVMMATAVADAAMTTLTSRTDVAPAAATIAARMTHAPERATSAMATTGVDAPINLILPVPLAVAHVTTGMRAVGAADAVAIPTQREIAQPVISGRPYVMTGMRAHVARAAPRLRTPAVVVDAQAQPLRKHAVASGMTRRWPPQGGVGQTCATLARPDLARSRMKRRQLLAQRPLARR